MSVLSRLAKAADALVDHGRVLVAVDGPDAAGKTTLADELAATLTTPAVRASIDGFHRPRAARLRRGDRSPEGYYRDSFDLSTLEQQLLGPFARGASTVTTRAFDHRTDQPDVVRENLPARAVLVVDGVFLLRPELRHWWTLSVYVHVPEAVTLARARVRDADELRGPDAVETRYRERYLPGQGLYRQEARPHDHADVVLDNSNPASPQLLRCRPTAAPSGSRRPAG